MTGTLFPEWLEAHKEEHALPFRIQQMLNIHGRMPGKTCKTCAHLQRYKQSARWMKCDLTKITGGTGTDWKASWPACGKYEEESK